MLEKMGFFFFAADRDQTREVDAVFQRVVFVDLLEEGVKKEEQGLRNNYRDILQRSNSECDKALTLIARCFQSSSPPASQLGQHQPSPATVPQSQRKKSVASIPTQVLEPTLCHNGTLIAATIALII